MVPLTLLANVGVVTVVMFCPNCRVEVDVIVLRVVRLETDGIIAVPLTLVGNVDDVVIVVRVC